MLKRKFEAFCLLCSETMRKMFQLLSFGFRKIPYESAIIKNDLSKSNETCRTDSLSEEDSKNINYVGRMP